MLAAALLGLLPEAVELAGPDGYQSVGLSLLGGIALFFVLEKLVLWRHCHEDTAKRTRPTTTDRTTADRRRSSGAMVLDRRQRPQRARRRADRRGVPHRLQLGVLTGVAIMAHEVPSEVGDFAVLLHAGMTRAARLFWNLLSALGSVIGGVLGYYALAGLRPCCPMRWACPRPACCTSPWPT